MIKSSALRVAPGADGVSIWSSEIFGDAEASRLRDFLARAFAVREVEDVELRRADSFGRIRYGSVSNPAQIWKKLSRALGSTSDASSALQPQDAPVRRVDAGLVYLDGPGARPVRVSRIGGSLSTWRVRHEGESTLRLWHPILRNRRDVVFRLEEELAAILGVEDFRASSLTAGVSIRFDKDALTAERLARELEKAWPRLLEGLDGPPSPTRLVAAVGLLGLAYTGQYLVPALKPVAVAGVVLYGLPNIVKGVKQLARGQVGASAMYATGLGYLLVGGMPFPSTVIAVLMQLWPHLARRRFVRSQRRLFAGQRRRPAWARIRQPDGSELELNVDELVEGDLIVVASGEIIPVDGVVEAGAAAVIDEAPFGGDEADDRLQGDVVSAGAFVREGSLTIRVERAGAETLASYVASLLPHNAIEGMPSTWEAERIADRNARPALALSLASLAVTRTLRPSQVLIRPDYVTAPRLSAQLSALHGIADGLQQGVLFKKPAALDRLAATQVFVFDDSAGLDRRSVEVAAVQPVTGFSHDQILGYAAAAHAGLSTEQGRALALSQSSRSTPVDPGFEASERAPGVTRYRDRSGSTIEIAASAYLSLAKIEVPARLQPALAPRSADPSSRRTVTERGESERSLRPLWVLRDGSLIGVVTFARSGEAVGKALVAALRAQSPRARFLYLSRKGEAETMALAIPLGIDAAHGGLSSADKVDLIRGLGQSTLWVGDGSDPEALQATTASSVSVSVAPLTRAREDSADILLPRQGLAGLPELVELAREHQQRLTQDYRTVYAVNLLGAAGALSPRVTSLHAGLLSNVGTGLIYARHTLGLGRLAFATEARRARRKSPLTR
jgi:cation transport ATPase